MLFITQMKDSKYIQEKNLEKTITDSIVLYLLIANCI